MIKQEVKDKIYDLITNNINRSIFLDVEGSGKSTEFINQILLNRNSIDKTFIFGSHTIKNSKEKYNYAIKNFKNPDGDIRYIKSDSELFRDVIESQDKYLSEKMMDVEFLSTKFLSYRMFSYNSGKSFSNKFHELNISSSFKNNLKAAREFDTTCEGYNTIINKSIYNSLFNVAGRLSYYLFYKFNSTEIPIEVDVLKILSNNNLDINKTNLELEVNGIKCLCISGTAIKNWKGFRIERDKYIKESFNHPTKKYIIFVQNRVMEEYIVGKYNENICYICDELTDSDFICFNGGSIKPLSRIISKIKKHGIDSLSYRDKSELNGLNIPIEDIKKFESKEDQVSIELGIHKLVVLAHRKEGFDFIGKPLFSDRLQSFDNTIILTTEHLPAKIISKALSYDIIDFTDDYKYQDNKFFITPVSNINGLAIIKQNKDKISSFIDLLKNSETKKSEVLCAGTKYFGTDVSLTACKGRNYKNLKKFYIFTNPMNAFRIAKYVNYVDHYFTEKPKNIEDYVEEGLRIDELNQTIARISGNRRSINKDTIIKLFYYSKDKFAKSSISKIRYKGINISELEFEKEYNELKSSQKCYNTDYKWLLDFFSVYNDVDHISNNFNSPIGNLSFENIIKSSNGLLSEYTKKGIIERFIPKIFAFIKTQIISNIHDIKNVLDPDYYMTGLENDIDSIKNKKNYVVQKLNEFLEKKDTIRSIDLIDSIISSLEKGDYSVINKLKYNKFDYKLFVKSNFIYYTLLIDNNKPLLNKFKTNLSTALLYMHSIDGLINIEKTFNQRMNLKHKNRTRKFKGDILMYNPLNVYRALVTNKINDISDILVERRSIISTDVIHTLKELKENSHIGKSLSKLDNISTRPSEYSKVNSSSFLRPVNDLIELVTLASHIPVNQFNYGLFSYPSDIDKNSNHFKPLRQ